MTLNEEKENSKKELNKIIKSLNEIIATNSEILYHKEPDPIIMKQLERVLEIRKKDLQMSKRTNQTFKSQYEVIGNKANTKLSVERLNVIELKIDVIKKENADLIKKTRELKNKNSIQSKELEICSDNKVHPKKIISYTNEIKSLSSKKHEYHVKLSANKKSLNNTLKELKKLEDLYYSFLTEETSETVAKKISEWITMIKSDLDGTEDEILNRAEQNSSKVLKAMERERKKNKEMQSVLPIVNTGPRARSSSPKTKDNTLIKKDNITNKPKETQPYKGIFNKFIYLKPKGKLPHYMKNSRQGKRGKEEIKNENFDITEIIEYDYDNTSNTDYRELLNKKELYVDINQRIEKSIKELEKMSDKKLKDISGTIDSNARRLNSLQQQNHFLQLEITNLSKILSLNHEQSRIRKEINHNESKMYKMNNPLQHTNNDASMTNNDLSQEFNYLKDEEEKKRSFQPTNSNIIEEENENNAKQRVIDIEHADSNKNIKCKCKEYITLIINSS